MIWKAIFSAVGLGSLIFILRGYGLDKILHNILDLGWWSVPLALSFLPVAFCYAASWLLVTPELDLSSASFFFRTTLIGVAWNNLSPFVKILGEPLKVMMLEQKIGRKAALQSVVLCNLVHVLGTMAAFVLGASILLFLFPVVTSIRLAFLSVIGISISLMVLIYFLPSVAKLRPGKNKNRNFMMKLRFNLRWGLSKIRKVSRQRPLRFWGGVGFEVVARFIEGVTFYVAFHALGHPLSFAYCALLDVGRALMDNIFFFIPYQMGTREAGILLLTQHVMHVDVGSVLSAAIFYRLVEILWMGIGYLLYIFWIRSDRLAKSST